MKSHRLTRQDVDSVVNPDIRSALMQAYRLTRSKFPDEFATAILVSPYRTEFIGNIPNVYSPLTATPVLAEVPMTVAQYFTDNLKMPTASR